MSLDTVLEAVNLRTRNRVSFCLGSRERWGGGKRQAENHCKQGP